MIDPVDITASLRGQTAPAADTDPDNTNPAARYATGALEAPPYTDPEDVVNFAASGLPGNPTGIGFAQASTPTAKPGARVVSDDAAEEISPFQVGA